MGGSEEATDTGSARMRSSGQAREEAFTEWYRQEFRRALALAYALSGGWAVAEELTQDAFLAVLRDWDRVEHMDHPRAWLHRVLVNRSASHLRRVYAERRASRRKGSLDRPETTQPVEAQDDVWRLVRQLPRRQAQAIALRYVLDLPRAEVAAAMGCTDETAKTHLARGLAALERRLDETRRTP